MIRIWDLSGIEDTAFDMEDLLEQQTKAPDVIEDVEVDIIENINPSNVRLPEVEDPDATEYSSSFGNTFSATENDSRSSDAEVESQFCVDNGSSSFFDGFGRVFQTRKKLTAHWRRFIHPLKWRCKWLELKIKEFQSQALKYDRELASYDQRKQFESGKFTSSGLGAKERQFSCQNRKNKIMKRRKRKRVEGKVNMPSYISCHNLFSYYETKRPYADDASMDDDCGNRVMAADHTNNVNDEISVNGEWPLFEFKDDSFLEQVLWKVEVLQSRVHKLKNQLDSVVCKNVGKFSSVENLSLLASCDAPISSARSPTSSTCNGDTVPIGALYSPPQHMSEYDVDDLVLPESAVSSYGEANPLPDIFETTIGLLSTVNVTLDQQEVGDSCNDVVDNILVHNLAAEGELHDFEKFSSQPIDKPLELRKEQEESIISSPVQASEIHPATKITVPQEESSLKSCLASELVVPKNKRKRGERKASLDSWSRKSASEPDHQ